MLFYRSNEVFADKLDDYLNSSEKSTVSVENNEIRNGENELDNSLMESFNKHYTSYLEQHSTNKANQSENVHIVETNKDEVNNLLTEGSDAALIALNNAMGSLISEAKEKEALEAPALEEEVVEAPVAEEEEAYVTPVLEVDVDESPVLDEETYVAPALEEGVVEAPVAEEEGTYVAPVFEEEVDESPVAEEMVYEEDEIDLGAEFEPSFTGLPSDSILDDEEDYYFASSSDVDFEEEEEPFYEEESAFVPEPAAPVADVAPVAEAKPTVVEREVVREIIVVDRDQARDLGYGADGTSNAGYQGSNNTAPAPSYSQPAPAPSYSQPAPAANPAPAPQTSRFERPVEVSPPQAPAARTKPMFEAPVTPPSRTEEPTPQIAGMYSDEEVVISPRKKEKSSLFGGLFGKKKEKPVFEEDSSYVSDMSGVGESSRVVDEGSVEDEYAVGADDSVISLRTQDNYDPREERRRLQHVTTEQREVDSANWLEQTMLDALKMDASDLHIVVDGETKDLRVRIRVDGQMQDFDYVTGIPARVIMGRLKAATKLSSGGSFAPEETIYALQLDGESRKARAVLFRVEDGGEALVMRLPLTGSLRQLDELAFSEKNLNLVLDLLAMPYKLIMIAGPMGSGKGSPAWERILTPEGWTTYGDIAVGDYVVGSDGNSTEVTGVFPRGELDVYKVTFNDGSAVTVDGDHLWSVQSPDDRHEGRGYRTISTSELASKPLRNPKTNNGHKWFIPVVQPVQFVAQETSLPVHPYVLGSLLGDGTFEGRGVGFSTVDEEFATRVNAFLPEGISLRLLDEAPSRAGKCPHYNVVGDGKKNELLRTFRAMGMLGKKSVEKFVPEEYLYSSVEERLELLRGLMDSDGHAVKAGRAEFSSVSKNLAEAVVFIARSLGGVATMKERNTSYTDKNGEKAAGQLSYRVSVKLPAQFNPFSLSRKANAWVAPTKYPVTRAITSIEPAGRDEVICIQVEAENSLYVADHFIVTHNTTTAHGALLHVASPFRTVWTIEDPVERRLPNLVQLEIDEENGAGFDVLLSKLLRADYNTLFLGEIRDNDTASAAVRQAKAGRQVMSTIHADDNIKSLMRLIELAGDSPMSVLSAVGGVISQRLVRRLNPEWDGIDPNKKYKGRIPIHEILFVNDEIVEVMMQDRPLSEIKAKVRQAKGSTFYEDATRLINAGVTDREEVVRVIGEFDVDYQN